jgi:hypothetical protein
LGHNDTALETLAHVSNHFLAEVWPNKRQGNYAMFADALLPWRKMGVSPQDRNLPRIETADLRGQECAKRFELLARPGTHSRS